MTDLLAFILAGAAYLDPTHDHAQIADAMATVIEQEPALFADDAAKHKTASLILAVAFREGSLRVSVEGDRDKKGKAHSYCALQINDSVGGSPELNVDTVSCIRIGHRMLRSSMGACRVHPIAIYAEGPRGCGSVRAQRISRDRMALAKRVEVAAEKALEVE